MSASPITRPLAVACLIGVAVTHLVDLSDKLEEAHYMAAMFCALIAASLVLAGALAAGYRVGPALVAAGTLSALTIAGYVLSRTVGLPQLEDHVGMWTDPAGVASLVFEGTLVVLALAALPLPALEVGGQSTRASAR